MPKKPLSLRMRPEVLAALERAARRRRLPKSSLIERYVEEGLRMDTHPDIVFVDGPAGRRPALRRGPDVWEVVMVWQDNDGSVPATAKHLAKSERDIEAALAYYADHKAEIDDWLKRNEEESTAEEAAWRRQQAARG